MIINSDVYAVGEGTAGDFSHNGDSPRLYIGKGWDGFVSHVVIKTPG